MCKFSTQDDERYAIVWTNLQDLVQKCLVAGSRDTSEYHNIRMRLRTNLSTIYQYYRPKSSVNVLVVFIDHPRTNLTEP